MKQEEQPIGGGSSGSRGRQVDGIICGYRYGRCLGGRRTPCCCWERQVVIGAVMGFRVVIGEAGGRHRQ